MLYSQHVCDGKVILFKFEINEIFVECTLQVLYFKIVILDKLNLNSISNLEVFCFGILLNNESKAVGPGQKNQAPVLKKNGISILNNCHHLQLFYFTFRKSTSPQVNNLHKNTINNVTRYCQHITLCPCQQLTRSITSH